MQGGAVVVGGESFSVCSSGMALKAGWVTSLSGDNACVNDDPVFCAEGLAWGLGNRWGAEVFLTSTDSIACRSAESCATAVLEAIGFPLEKRGA